MPSFPQRSNDDFHGWPVSPQHQQHPVRGTFLDPRPDPDLGAIYHTGADVAVRNDKPEAGAPAGIATAATGSTWRRRTSAATRSAGTSSSSS